MTLLNPVHALLTPFLFFVTLPLAIFAGITTILAFSVLFLRVVIVYLDIALSLLPKAPLGLTIGLGPQPIAPSARLTPRASRAAVFAGAALPAASDHHHRSHNASASPSSIRRRRRRPSSVSVMSAGTVTPSGEVGLGLLPSIGLERDYEGIGGWRVGDDSDDVAAMGGEDVWTTIHSRLELTDGGRSSHRARGHYHHHGGHSHGHSHGQFRSSSSGPTTPGEGGYLMMKGRDHSLDPKRDEVSKPAASPNSSRARTPSRPRAVLSTKGPADGYFPLTASPKAAKR